MRNLKLIATWQWTPDSDLFSSDLGPASAFGLMEETHEQFVFLARGCVIVRLNPKENSVLTLQLHREFPLEEDDRVVALQPVFDQLLIVTRFRAFACDVSFEHLELLREFPIAVTSALWSPNLDAIALLTSDERLHFASGCDLTPRGPEEGLELHPDHFGRAAQVNLGWGKKETQFHGSEGKAAAVRKTAPNPAASALEPTWRFGLSWQGDSELLAVSAFDLSSRRRSLRFWTPDGELHATGEPGGGANQPLLEGSAVAWRGAGNRVAVGGRRLAPSAPPEVVLYERNGLQHRQLGCSFAVRAAGARRIGALAFSADLELLAVGAERVKEEEEAEEKDALCDCVQVWICSNRHWYLKFALDFPEDRRVSQLAWDPLETDLLHLLAEDGSYRSLEFGWTTSRSFAEDHQSVVASIDGARLLFTPFASACVPPPMSASVLCLPAPALQVAFACDPDWPNDCAVQLADGSLLLVSLQESEEDTAKLDEGLTVERPILAGASPFAVRRLLPPGSLPSDAAHLTWSGRGVAVVVPEAGNRCELLEVPWDSEEPRRRALPSPLVPAGLCSSPGGQLFLQDAEGGVWRCEEATWTRVGRLDCRCSDWAVLDASESCPEVLPVGLQPSLHRLVANDQVLLTNCTSFALHGQSDFLLVTTTKNRLISCPLRPTATAAALRSAAERCEKDAGGELVRELERGSRLVTSASASAKVVLQLPRGNLETVSPRALVLAAARSAIDNGNYRSAYQLIRRHRVNTNLLFDHAFDRFEREPGNFLAAIGSAEDVNMVLAELSEEDITSTLYTAHYGERTTGRPPSCGKVEIVCSKIEEECQKDLKRYLSCVLTCRAKRQRLAEALCLVHTQHQSGLLTESGVESAMRTLGYFAEIRQLFRIALGTFDLGIVMLVLNNSSLDPSEHLPFLTELRALPEQLRRFRIDLHIERFRRAISHVLPSGDTSVFEEALQLIKQKNLYAAAMQHYQDDEVKTDEFKTISRAFAEHLRASSALEDAGRVLLRCGDLAEAARCFLGSGNWRLWAAATTVQESKGGQNGRGENNKEAATLAASLEARGDFVAACRVLTQFGGDPKAAFEAAVRGALWEEAFCVARTSGLDGVIETDLRPAMLAAQEALVERAKALEQEFMERAARMLRLRREYRVRVTEEMSRWGDEEGVGADLYSETSSLADSSSAASVSSSLSSTSTSSRRSSKKSRRKEARKRWLLKEGAPLEGVALMERLSQLVAGAGRLKQEAVELEAGLNLLGLSGEAFAGVDAAARLLRELRRRRDDVWSDHVRAKAPEAPPAEDLVPLSRQFEGVLEPFLFHPPDFESPPAPSPLSCPPVTR